MLQTLPVVALLADAVVLSRVCAALAAGHQVTAIPAGVAQRGAERQILLDVAARGEVCPGGGKQMRRAQVRSGQTRHFNARHEKKHLHGTLRSHLPRAGRTSVKSFLSFGS